MTTEAVKWLEQDYDSWTYEPFTKYAHEYAADYNELADSGELIDTWVEDAQGRDLSNDRENSRPMFEVLGMGGGALASWCSECVDEKAWDSHGMHPAGVAARIETQRQHINLDYLFTPNVEIGEAAPRTFTPPRRRMWGIWGGVEHYSISEETLQAMKEQLEQCASRVQEATTAIQGMTPSQVIVDEVPWSAKFFENSGSNDAS